MDCAVLRSTDPTVRVVDGIGANATPGISSSSSPTFSLWLLRDLISNVSALDMFTVVVTYQPERPPQSVLSESVDADGLTAASGWDILPHAQCIHRGLAISVHVTCRGLAVHQQEKYTTLTVIALASVF